MTQRTGNEARKIIELIKLEEEVISTMAMEIFAHLIATMIGQINLWIEPLTMLVEDYTNLYL